MSPTLSRSSALKLGVVHEIRDGIIFDFYSGLPHIYIAAISLLDSLSVYKFLTKHEEFAECHYNISS